MEEDVISDLRRDLPKKAFRMIFDVGANTGQSAVEYAGRFPDAQIYSFEPVRDTFQQLVEAAKPFPNVKPYCVALSKESGERTIALGGNSTMNRFVQGAPPGNSESVQLATLTEFCRENDIPHIDFLKIDTEGHDLDVILGADEFLDNVDILQCEVAANPYNRFHVFFGDVWPHLFAKNFYLYKIYGQTKEWTGGGYPVLRRFDCVFINARVVGPLNNVIDH